ncbi:hypothetical protein EVAR_29889_1 [Eumeta japonica]|uniref:Uncharacterized protein n=1 Tax=Eumeta variegata TaxID=151549 RepID=A0A4C1V958_EUMVA|nr:hypothetical protein EVAR_29889_1 [Eumeta japonica]
MLPVTINLWTAITGYDCTGARGPDVRAGDSSFGKYTTSDWGRVLRLVFQGLRDLFDDVMFVDTGFYQRHEDVMNYAVDMRRK